MLFTLSASRGLTIGPIKKQNTVLSTENAQQSIMGDVLTAIPVNIRWSSGKNVSLPFCLEIITINVFNETCGSIDK